MLGSATAPQGKPFHKTSTDTFLKCVIGCIDQVSFTRPPPGHPRFTVPSPLRLRRRVECKGRPSGPHLRSSPRIGEVSVTHDRLHHRQERWKDERRCSAGAAELLRRPRSTPSFQSTTLLDLSFPLSLLQIVSNTRATPSHRDLQVPSMSNISNPKVFAVVGRLFRARSPVVSR